MTILGWLTMTVSIGSVLALATFCLVKVLTLPPVEVEDLSAPTLQGDPPDAREA